MRARSRNRAGTGFTLIEALLSIVIIALIAMVTSNLFSTGLQATDAFRDRAILDGYLTGRMEKLISTNFDQLVNGTETVSVGGQNYTINWTVSDADLDGDTIPETGAKEVTVTTDDLALSTIIVDTSGQLGKI
ncbi:MAG: prepilin-type N-terminal cleavage/methylation domain-containing protein [Candidatus Hydrogenedentes bacterium]|nr:prepilin-type N-terminal cleavage/methylation domain-containing protein [Candidatus Hydrogenedentota bacterium]